MQPIASKRQLHTPESYSALLSSTSLALAEAVRTSGETDKLVDSLANNLELTGVYFPTTNYSLVVSLERSLIPQPSQEVIAKWGTQEGLIRIPFAPPLHETTGTHGSGERQKLAESIKTVCLDCVDENTPVFSFRLWGRYSGLYWRLSDALSFTAPIGAVRSFEIASGPDWMRVLVENAERVYELGNSRWPDFVADQLTELRHQMIGSKTAG